MRLFAGTPWDQPPSCQQCGESESDCTCPPVEKAARTQVAPSKQTVRLAVEKRKRGKQMTVVRGLAAADNDLPALLTQLKTQCGAGGTLKDDSIEIQGNHLQRIQQVLKQIGYRV